MKTKKVILAIVGILFLLAGVAAGVYLVRRQQLLEKKALTPGGTAQMYLSPETKQAAAGEQFTVDVMLDSTGSEISGFQARLTFPDNQGFTLNGNPTPNQHLITPNDQWTYQRLFQSSDGTNTTIDIIAQYTSTQGYQAFSPFPIATLNFVAAGSGTGNITLSFDQSQSVVQAKSPPGDILGSATSGTYFLGGGTAPSSTPSPSPTTDANNPTNSPTPSPTGSTVNPTSSPTPSPTTGTTDPTNTPAPTATPTTSSGDNTSSANPTPTTAAGSASELPVAGSTLPTIALLIAGTGILLLGFFLTFRPL